MSSQNSSNFFKLKPFFPIESYPRNETDVVLASLAFNLDRDEVIDYTIPVFPRITLTLWSPLGNRAPLNYTAFIDVFPLNVWILIGFTFLVIAAAFYIIGTIHIRRLQHFKIFCAPFPPCPHLGTE